LDNKPLHPGIALTETYIQSLRMPVQYVAKLTGIQLDVAQAFFDGAMDLNRQQAEAMQGLLRGWWSADEILEQQDASKGVEREPV